MEEKEEEEKQKLLQLQVPGLRTINARAKVMNRTVTKEINLKKNELSCRPYVRPLSSPVVWRETMRDGSVSPTPNSQIRTTYWSIGEEGDAAAGDAVPEEAAKPATPKAAEKQKVTKDYFFDDDDVPSSAPAASKTPAADDALARAVKTELKVVVDVSKTQNPTNKGPEEVALPQRTANPLKPAATAAPTAGVGKVPSSFIPVSLLPILLLPSSVPSSSSLSLFSFSPSTFSPLPP